MAMPFCSITIYNVECSCGSWLPFVHVQTEKFSLEFVQNSELLDLASKPLYTVPVYQAIVPDKSFEENLVVCFFCKYASDTSNFSRKFDVLL